MDKVYSLINWENAPNTSTPLGRMNLRKVDVAVNSIDDRVIAMDTSKANQSTVNSVVKEITYEESTGILTITKVNNTSTQIDTKLEKLAVNFSYDPVTQQLIITLDDGTKQYVDLSALITQYEFEDTDTVSFSVQPDGKIKANVIPGSITGEMLEPNYLADIIVQANIATTQAGVSTEAAAEALGYRNEAEIFKDEAKQYRDEAESIVGVGIASETAIGLVKGNGNVEVKTDGAMWADPYKDKSTATGTSVQFTDADDALIAITAMGGTGSVTVVATNNNVINPNRTPVTQAGITAIMQEDKSYILNGTASDSSGVFILGNTYSGSVVFTLRKGTYVLRGTGTSLLGIYLYKVDGTTINTSTNNLTFTLSADTDFSSISLRWFTASIVLNNVRVYPQVSFGNTLTAYEPYHGNTLTIPDVTTATYPVYLTSYKGITNVFTLSAAQPIFTAIAKSELWSNDYRKVNRDGSTPMDSLTVGSRLTGSAIGSNSTVLGSGNEASGIYSIAEGFNSIASGIVSHSEGNNTKALGGNSHSEGSNTTANGNYSHAEGSTTTAYGDCTHAEGYNTNAIGLRSHAEGSENVAASDFGHAEGVWNLVSTGVQYNITAFNNTNKTLTLENITGISIGTSLDIKVNNAIAILGLNVTDISGNIITLDTTKTITSDWMIAIRRGNGTASHAEGMNNLLTGTYSHVEGASNNSGGYASHAEGLLTKAIHDEAHAEGHSTTASNYQSHAEGYKTIASGGRSHAEGDTTVASGNYAHAEGIQTVASGAASHAEGDRTNANGTASHAEGVLTKATGAYSHAGGNGTESNGTCSFATGSATKANGDNQTVIGRFNSPNTTDLFQVGNGTSDAARANSLRVDNSGDLWSQGYPVPRIRTIVISLVSTSGSYDISIPDGITHVTIVQNSDYASNPVEIMGTTNISTTLLRVYYRNGTLGAARLSILTTGAVWA